MKKITEPTPYVYNWAIRRTTTTSSVNGYVCLVAPLLQWNDAQDISIMHNYLQGQLGQGMPAPTTILPPMDKFAVGAYKAEFTIKNAENMEVSYDLYMCTVRNDMDATLAPSTAWGSSSKVFYANLLALLPQGITEQNGGNPNIPTPSLTYWPVGITPYDIAKFCSYVKINKCKRNQVLLGGGFKSYSVRDKKWRMWNGTKVNGCTNATNAVDVCFAKRTRFIFAIFKAQAIDDHSLSTTAPNANYANVNMLFSGNERYEYTGVNNAVKYFQYASDVSAIIPANVSTLDLQTELQSGYVVA